MKLAIASLVVCSAAAFVPTGGNRQFPTTNPSTTELYGRKPFISGNWKLNPQTKEEALTLASGIASSINENSPDVDVALFVPYVFIETAISAVGGKLAVGAEVNKFIFIGVFTRNAFPFIVIVILGVYNRQHASLKFSR